MLGPKGFEIRCRGSFEHPLELVAQSLLSQFLYYPLIYRLFAHTINHAIYL